MSVDAHAGGLREPRVSLRGWCYYTTSSLNTGSTRAVPWGMFLGEVAPTFAQRAHKAVPGYAVGVTETRLVVDNLEPS